MPRQEMLIDSSLRISKMPDREHLHLPLPCVTRTVELPVMSCHLSPSVSFSVHTCTCSANNQHHYPRTHSPTSYCFQLEHIQLLSRYLAQTQRHVSLDRRTQHIHTPPSAEPSPAWPTRARPAISRSPLLSSRPLTRSMSSPSRCLLL
jgi:hypothetical protein